MTAERGQIKRPKQDRSQLRSRTVSSNLGPEGVSFAGWPDRELGASALACMSTPVPKRKTSSPPSQPVTSARPTATNEDTNATVGGFSEAGRRKNQLTTNNNTTNTLPAPCQRPIRCARVPEGIASQSAYPKTAANKPGSVNTSALINTNPEAFEYQVLTIPGRHFRKPWVVRLCNQMPPGRQLSSAPHH
jgi:hypothetical protein